MAEVVIEDYREVVLGNAVVSTSGNSVVFQGFGAKEIVLVVNVSGAVTGTTPTLQFTVKEIDPGDGATVIGVSVTGAQITATGTQILVLPVTRSSYVQVTWTVTGTTPVFNGVYATLVNKVAGTSTLYDNLGNAVFGTAGSPGTAVLTVQGASGGQPSPVSGTVTSNQGTANTAANGWPVKVTDGTNIQPTMDVAARKAFVALTDGTNTAAVKAASTAAAAADPSAVVGLSPNSPLPAGSNALGTVTAVQATAANLNATAAQGAPNSLANKWPVQVTDGTNTMPTGDTVGRAIFEKITDGTNVAAVKAASTAAVATDPSLVVGLSPNSPLPAGSNSIGGVTQGTAAASAGAWPVKVTDGTNTAAVKAASTAAVATDPAIVVAVSPNNGLALDASITAQSVVDNAAFTDGTTRVQPVGFILDEVAGTALSENDAGAARIDSKRAQVIVIEDGTTRGTRTVVKAASTAAVATDPALVVAISPNNTVSLGPVSVSQSDTTATGSLGALNNTVSVALAGTAGVGMQLVAGTLIGTIVPEASLDGGTTWTTAYFFDQISGVLTSSVVFASSNAATARAVIIVGGVSHVRIRVSVYTSGTATCNLRTTTANDPSTAIRGTDGTNLRTVLLDTSGRIIVAPAGASSTTSGFVSGDVALTVTGNVVIRRTALTEQSSNAQRSIVSSSANDTSAGTGARTVKITYYDSTGAGPSTETVTLNGTTAVNTVSTTICYVERLEVLTVGSTGSNVGALTLKAATAGGGATIMTMNATDIQTYLGLHYVPTGKTCYITGMNVGSTSSGIAQGGLFTLRSQALTANAPDRQISDGLYLFGQSSGFTRTYGTPIQVAGPARLQMWVNPFSNNTVTFAGGFDFYEQ